MSSAALERTTSGVEFPQRIAAGEMAGRLACSEATLVDGSGKLICHGTGSCLILPR